MSKMIVMNAGATAFGDQGQGVLSGGSTYTVSDALAGDLVNRGLAQYAAAQVAVSPYAQTPLPIGGFKIGVLGASFVARNHVQFKCAVGNYTRSGNVVTAIINKPQSGAAINWFPGHAIRFGAQNNPELEGWFQVTASQNVDATFHRLQWYDPRPDTSTMAADAEVSDLHAFSTFNAWLQAMNVAFDGRCDFYAVGTGSTNLAQWDKDRMQQLLQWAPFDAILMNGIIENSLLNIANGNGGLTWDQLKANIQWVIEYLLQFCRVLVIPTPPGNRNVAPSSAAFTTGALLIRWLYTEAIQKYRNLVVVPQGEILGSNWQDPSAALNSDVMANMPPVRWMANDGTHCSWPGMIRVGAAHALVTQKLLGFFVPEMGSMAQSRAENSVPELGGRYNSVVGSGRWGQRTLKGSPDVGTGQQPTNTSMSVTNPPGGATSTHTVTANPEGGYDWTITIADPSGSALGGIYTFEDQYVGNGSLLTILNDSKNWGKRLRGEVPLGVNWTNEYAVWAVEAGIFGTVGGVEYQIGSMLSAKGVYGLTGGTKVMVANGSVAAGGTGYAVGDTLTLSGGTFTQVAKLVVTAVSGGAITRFMVFQPGLYNAAVGNPASVTGGSGSGATFNLNWEPAVWTCDWGISGNLALPKDVTVPVGQTFTSAVMRVVVTGLPSTGMGVLTTRFAAGALFEAVG